MPLILKIPGKDLYDAEHNRFITVKDTTLTLEHSLLSLSKWESKWHKPYLAREEPTVEELIDYIRCMTLTQNVNPNIYTSLDEKSLRQILEYMKDPQTATTIRRQDQRKNGKIITSEVLYAWMAELKIPFEPCEKWHLNRLLTLIEVVSIDKQPPKKMSPRAVARHNNSLNAARRARLHSRG